MFINPTPRVSFYAVVGLLTLGLVSGAYLIQQETNTSPKAAGQVQLRLSTDCAGNASRIILQWDFVLFDNAFVSRTPDGKSYQVSGHFDRNVVPVYDIGDPGQTYTYTMTVLDGEAQGSTSTATITLPTNCSSTPTATPSPSASPTPQPTGAPKTGDINEDTHVNLQDYVVLFENFQKVPPPNPKADITGPGGVKDGKVNLQDYALFFDHFGE